LLQARIFLTKVNQSSGDSYADDKNVTFWKGASEEISTSNVQNKQDEKEKFRMNLYQISNKRLR